MNKLKLRTQTKEPRKMERDRSNNYPIWIISHLRHEKIGADRNCCTTPFCHNMISPLCWQVFPFSKEMIAQYLYKITYC